MVYLLIIISGEWSKFCKPKWIKLGEPIDKSDSIDTETSLNNLPLHFSVGQQVLLLRHRSRSRECCLWVCHTVSSSSCSAKRHPGGPTKPHHPLRFLPRGQFSSHCCLRCCAWCCLPALFNAPAHVFGPSGFRKPLTTLAVQGWCMTCRTICFLWTWTTFTQYWRLDRSV